MLESQAYDSAMILRQLISQGEASRVGLAESLARVREFSGALGDLRITQRREFIRPVVGLNVTEGHITPFSEKSEKK